MPEGLCRPVSTWLVSLVVLLLGACSTTSDYRGRSIVASLDTRADPCQDFYQYACGGWLDQVSLAPDQSLWRRSFSALQRNNLRAVEGIIIDAQTGQWEPVGASDDTENQQRVADFFETCLDDRAARQLGIEPLRPFLAQAAEIANAADAMRLSGRLRRSLAAPLLAGAVWPDYRDPDRYMMHFAQSGLGLPSPAYYSNGNQDLLDAYEQYLVRMFGHFDLPLSAEAAGSIVDFETALAQRWAPLASQRDPAQAFNPIDPRDFQGGQYLSLFAAYFDGLGLALPQQINITSPDYLIALAQLLEQTSPQMLANYYRWRIVDEHSALYGAAARRISFAFRATRLQGVTRQASRRHECVVMTHQALGDAIGERFVAQGFSEQQREQARNLLLDLKAQLAEHIAQAQWMTTEDQRAAQQKVTHMRLKVGFPDHWRDYQGLDLGNHSLLDNVLAVREFEVSDQNRHFYGPVDREEWAVDVFKVNAYYNASANEVVFPAGILMPPLFNPNGPDAVNYGAIGSMMAHELSHGFDSNGSLFGFDGRLHEGWQETTQQGFAKRSACVAEHFGALANEDHNRELTLPENMADLTGLALAWDAFEGKAESGTGGENGDAATGSSDRDAQVLSATGLDPGQLFFVSFAQSWCSLERDRSASLARQIDPHADARTRVNAAVSGVPGFATSFHCPLATPMNPANRCIKP